MFSCHDWESPTTWQNQLFGYLHSRPDAIILGTQRQTWALLSSVSVQAFQEVSGLLLTFVDGDFEKPRGKEGHGEALFPEA